MRVTWYAHACFRIESDGIAVVTDPYTPEHANLPSIEGSADLVVMSSSEDRAHSAADAVPGRPRVIDTLKLAEGECADPPPFSIRAIAGSEGAITHRARRETSAYTLDLDLSVCHLGDLGRLPPPPELARLGPVDVLLALAGGEPTLTLPDLDLAIEALAPRLVIPMHYATPRIRYQLGKVDSFLARHPATPVERIDGSTIDITRATLPRARTITVLEPLLG